MSTSQLVPRAEVRTQDRDSKTVVVHNFRITYYLVVAASICLWLLPIRSPLWLDETGSYWQISKGFFGILSRQPVSFPAYSYILWFSSKIIGTSEIALRIPSVLAMLGSVYLLYSVARDLFDVETALVTAVIFCLNPYVYFAAIDARPYAFGLLAETAATFVLLRLRRSDSNWLAVLFGILATCVVYFQFLWAAILPAFAICYFIVKKVDRKGIWRQFSIATGTLALGFLPMIPGLHELFSTKGTHVFEPAPKLSEALWIIAPGWLPFIVGGAAVIGFIVGPTTSRNPKWLRPVANWQPAVCASLAFIPLLILYSVSALTSVRMFSPRHCILVAPGAALCWALIVSYFRRPVRPLLCLALLAAAATFDLTSGASTHHGPSWKVALEVAEKNASVDGAPAVICSPFIESDYAPMPQDTGDSFLFVPLSYYKLTVRVVPLPIRLNREAIQAGSQFLNEAVKGHKRFLALGGKESYKTLAWMTQSVSGQFDVHKLGVYDQIEVLEFDPRARADALTGHDTGR